MPNTQCITLTHLSGLVNEGYLSRRIPNLSHILAHAPDTTRSLQIRLHRPEGNI